MEKNPSAMNSGTSGFVASPPPSAPPSAVPPPSAPPSYEEAVGSMNMVGAQGTVAPYPTGNAGIPAPYGPPGMLSGDVPSNPCAVPAQPRVEVRVVRQPVPYALGPNPVKMQCPSCMANIKTSTISQRQPSAHICCIILCVLGCCLCSCLPYCMSAFLTVHHHCPNCTMYIGTWKG